MTDPTISILIPCYNQARHIAHVVESACDQTHPPDEIIVVDDMSQDDSLVILRQLPVRVICHEQNQGPAVARNTALQAANGDILVYIDSDAYADRRMIEVLLGAYQDPVTRLLAGVGGRGIEEHLVTIYDRWRKLHAKQDFGQSHRDSVPYLFGLCMSYRREILAKVGGFDPSFPTSAGEDFELGYRLKRAGYTLRYTPDAIVYHQHSDDSEEKFRRIQYNWYYWGYLAKQRNRYHPWTLYAGTLRRLFTDTLSDLLLRRDARLARLDLTAFTAKISALQAARKYLQAAPID
jgi:glycosyltransferase involved in cell wall biosynthesis